MKKLVHLGVGMALSSLMVPVSAETTSVHYTSEPIVIDGKVTEQAWSKAQWHALDHHIVGDVPVPADFSGRYKLLWDEEQMYLLLEVIDDVLRDSHPDPRVQYWDDDCVEIFVDEDASGGKHQFNHNAFAYHIALDGNVADIGDTENDNRGVILLNDHVDSAWQRADTTPYAMTWEVAYRLYPDTYTTAAPGEPVALSQDKEVGFMLAYCDADEGDTREHFMGSHEIEPVNGDKNLGYIDASVFGRIKLVKPE